MSQAFTDRTLTTLSRSHEQRNLSVVTLRSTQCEEIASLPEAAAAL